MHLPVCPVPEDGWLVGVLHEVLDVAQLVVGGGQGPEAVVAAAHLDAKVLEGSLLGHELVGDAKCSGRSRPLKKPD